MDKLTASPLTIEIKGKSYQLSPLRNLEWGELISFIRSKRFSELQGLSVDKAIEEIDKITLHNFNGYISQYVDVLLKIVQLSLKKHQQTSMDELNELFSFGDDELNRCVNIIMSISVPKVQEVDQKKSQ